MTAWLDRVPVAEINAQARDYHPVRFVLTVLAGLLFVLGWLAARVLVAVWMPWPWMWAALVVGFRAGRAGGGRR